MKNRLGEIRRSQVITTHGPGSIIDFRAGSHGGAGVSVVAAGLEEWDRWASPPGLAHPQCVFEPRLQEELGVDGFRLPPVAPQTGVGVFANNAGKLPGVRFPTWLQCPKCHVIGAFQRWREDAYDPALYCAPCSEAAGGRNRVHVVPVRFVQICSDGHLDEFPWNWWVGHSDECKAPRDLKLVGSATAGLSGLVLSCTSCGARRSMEGCFSEGTTPQKCQGRRPWLGGDEVAEVCTAKARVVQRGASNIYFSVIESALAIPPWTDALQKRLGIFWQGLSAAKSSDERKILLQTLNTSLRLTETTGKTLDEIQEMVEDRVKRLKDGSKNIRWEEYRQFIQREAAFGENTEFEIHPGEPPPELSSWIKKIVRATRIREVRALKGFTRVLPYLTGEDARVAKISVNRQNWLPAVENRGEGIFIELNHDRLKTWEARQDVRNRAAVLHEEYKKLWHSRGRTGDPPRQVTARFLLIHGLAHALITQLSLSCGYNSASLRERLYVGADEWNMAGFLIFTSSPDADGTLGGLVRQGEAKYIVGVFEEMLLSMSWCSSDPLCIEDVHAMSSPGNGAACHACLLAAETSCEEFNSFLDRAMLVGTPSNPDLGFFKGLLDEIRSS